MPPKKPSLSPRPPAKPSCRPETASSCTYTKPANPAGSKQSAVSVNSSFADKPTRRFARSLRRSNAETQSVAESPRAFIFSALSSRNVAALALPWESRRIKLWYRVVVSHKDSRGWKSEWWAFDRRSARAVAQRPRSCSFSSVPGHPVDPWAANQTPQNSMPVARANRGSEKQSVAESPSAFIFSAFLRVPQRLCVKPSLLLLASSPACAFASWRLGVIRLICVHPCPSVVSSSCRLLLDPLAAIRAISG